MKERILVIEDDHHIQELLKYNLENNGYEVTIKEDGNEGYEEAINNPPHLILLDLMIPGIDGLEVCKKIRMDKRTSKIPILMVTAKSEEIDKILGLELGADDYITKPFSIKELIARIRAVLRRLTDINDTNLNYDNSSIIKLGDLEIDIEKYEVRLKDEQIILTFKEFELLKILAENKDKVLTRDYLLDKIWGYDYIGETRTVDVHIRHLRKKIWGKDSEGMIETIRGVGYKLKDIGEVKCREKYS